jgi:hypothetical protein
MPEPNVDVTMSGGQIQGIAGAGSVVIENFTHLQPGGADARRRHRTDRALSLSGAGIFRAE